MRKFRFLIVLIMCIFIFPCFVSAKDVEYTLFDSEVTVNTNRTLEVTESYKLYFIKNVETITRNINNRLVINREDKSQTLLSTKISNINSDTKHEIKNKDTFKAVTLKVDGVQDESENYEISYKYNLGKDTNKSIDEFYYEIASNLEDPSSNVTFTIIFPSTIDEKNVKFAIDDKYNLTEDDITYTVEDNVITGTLNKLLNPNQKLSIYVELPNNYFVAASDNFNYLNFLILIIPIIGTLILIKFFLKYGKENNLRIRRSGTILNDFDSAEIGYLYKGKLEETDLTTILLYLANQEYLQIIEYDDGYKLGKENSFSFMKLKEYDKNNAAQELIFQELFRDREEAKLNDIEYHFADTFNEAKSMLDNKDNRNKLFFNNFASANFISTILIVLSAVFVHFNGFYLFTNSLLLTIPLIAVLLLGVYLVFISNANGLAKIVVGGAILGFLTFVSVKSLLIQYQLLIIYIIGVVLITIMCLLHRRLSERTPFGAKVLSETYGLKYYLESISKQELEKRIEEDTNYFYKMIPYAYVLGSLEIWMKKGRDVVTSPPSWYIPSTEFNMNNFQTFIKNVVYTTTLVMMKQVYSESELVTYEDSTKVKTNLND